MSRHTAWSDPESQRHFGICLWWHSDRGSAQRSSPSGGPAAECSWWTAPAATSLVTPPPSCWDQASPGLPSSQDSTWWRLLVLAHFCLTQDSFTLQLLINHRSGWNFSKLLWNKALPTNLPAFFSFHRWCSAPWTEGSSYLLLLHPSLPITGLPMTWLLLPGRINKTEMYTGRMD